MLLLLLLQVVVDVRHEKSWRGTVDGFPLLVLRGTAAERGTAQGKLAGKDILRVIDALKGAVGRERWAPGRFTWPARFETELKALAAASGADVDDLRVLNCLSDLLGTGCSSFSAWGERTPDGQVITGRNADYGLLPVLAQIALVAVEPSEKGLKPTLELTILGNLGASTALNGDGAFLALHDEAGLPGRTSTWVPRTLALREAIETSATPEAIAEVLRKSPVKVGNSVHVSGPAPAVLEWDGNAKDGGVTLRRGENGFLACTNSYVARAARGPCDRYRRLSASTGQVDLEAAKTMLDAVAKSGNVATYFSVVVWPASKRYAFAVSPELGTSATKGRWITVEWGAVFK